MEEPLECGGLPPLSYTFRAFDVTKRRQAVALQRKMEETRPEHRLTNGS